MRHLLAHTAGLDNARLWQLFSLKPETATPLRDAFAGDPSLLRVRTRPGSRYSYSNMGYTLLGMVIESVTGERYERYLDTHLLRPLSMHDSTFEFVSQSGMHADTRLAMGHFEEGATQAAVPMYLRPAGQFTTTAAVLFFISAAPSRVLLTRWMSQPCWRYCNGQSFSRPGTFCRSDFGISLRRLVHDAGCLRDSRYRRCRGPRRAPISIYADMIPFFL